MSDQASRLVSSIDFTRDGKQCDFVRLPHSVHRSAYGWLPVPLACVKNGDGPTALLTSGVHGDEYEGQVALSRFIRELDPADVSGRIIVMPMANYPAAKAGLRVSPIDDLNLNRIFPGSADGSPTMLLAHYIETVLMPLADYSLDLHSGGSSLMYLPSTIISAEGSDDAIMAKKLELARVFGAPYGFIFPAGHATGSTSTSAAARNGVISLATEMGGSGTVTPECLRICEGGLRRWLRELGIWHGDVGAREAPAHETRMLAAPDWNSFTYASEDGLFEPAVDLGAEVRKGELAGYIHTPETPWREPAELHFGADGLVVCKRIPGRTERGDCLFHLGADYGG